MNKLINVKDIDPEEFGETYHTYGFDQSDEENGEVEKDIGREHYVAVGYDLIDHSWLSFNRSIYLCSHIEFKKLGYFFF